MMCGQLVSIVRSIFRESLWNIWPVERTSEVCEPTFWLGDMKFLTLSTNDECGQLVSIVRSVTREPPICDV